MDKATSFPFLAITLVVACHTGSIASQNDWVRLNLGEPNIAASKRVKMSYLMPDTMSSSCSTTKRFVVETVEAATKWSAISSSKARTPLGGRLMTLRRKIVESGAPLLSWDDIDREVIERRGEKV